MSDLCVSELLCRADVQADTVFIYQSVKRRKGGDAVVVTVCLWSVAVTSAPFYLYKNS